jgi:hypothetical protein
MSIMVNNILKQYKGKIKNKEARVLIKNKKGYVFCLMALPSTSLL